MSLLAESGEAKRRHILVEGIPIPKTGFAKQLLIRIVAHQQRDLAACKVVVSVF
jgi:hypothetical protein